MEYLRGRASINHNNQLKDEIPLKKKLRAKPYGVG
jgi:hypothetical protein